MSRSFRKTPICGYTTADSEKDDKRRANKAARAELRRRLSIDHEDADVNIREVSNVWLFSKDGKQWFGDLENQGGMWRK